MTEGLDTTNLLLGIMAAVSVLEALLLIALGVMGYRVYRQSMRAVRDLEQRQIAPLVARVNELMTKVDGILVDVKHVTGGITRQADRVESVRESVGSRVDQVMAFVQGARSALSSFFNGRHASRRAPAT